MLLNILNLIHDQEPSFGTVKPLLKDTLHTLISKVYFDNNINKEKLSFKTYLAKQVLTGMVL